MTSILAAEGGYQEFVLNGGEWAILALSGISAVLALGVGFVLMKDVLARTNKNSQNMFAEALSKIAGSAFGAPTWPNGHQAIHAFLTQLFIDPTHVVAADGSGLSRDNRVTARVMTDLLIAMQTDAVMRMPSIKLAERKLSGGDAPVWMYLFTWAAGVMRSGHGYELPFVFDNVHEPVLHPSASRQQLADRMADAWVAFARNGDPNHDGLADWPPYDLDARPTMLFDREVCRVEDDPWAAERQAWRR